MNSNILVLETGRKAETASVFAAIIPLTDWQTLQRFL
jgi:hypothetical protein